MDPVLVLVLAVSLTLLVCACCSLAEAALYAVPLPHVRHLAESGSRSGQILFDFKKNMASPISAVLILNTVASTGGASVAGWAGGQIFSELGVILFSSTFIFAILFISEIFPKIIGVAYCKPVARGIARPVHMVVRCLAPLIYISQLMSRFLASDSQTAAVSQEEFLSMAAMGTEDGSLDAFEGDVVSNVIELDQSLVRDLLTPRVVVFRLGESVRVGELRKTISSCEFSRIPLFLDDDRDHLVSYALQRDILRELLRGNDEVTLKDLSRPLNTVPELMRADQLLLEMFEKKEHICAVVDEHGGLAGIITLEDILEEILGREIVDEYDTVTDLRTFARIMRALSTRRKEQQEEEKEKKVG